MAKKKEKLEIQQVRDPQTLAQTLMKIQSQKELIEIAEKQVKAELLDILKMQGVRRVDLEDGRMYIRVSKSTLSIVAGFKDKAYKWAETNNALKVDTGVVKDILKRTGRLDKLPQGFKRTDTEYLRVAKKGENLEANEE